MNAKLLLIIFPILYYGIEKKCNAQDIWGMTKYGGEYNKGVIFNLNEDSSSLDVVYSFEDIGVPEGKMTEFTEGVFYGMTATGWKPGYGIIYRFDSSTGGLTKIMDFNGTATGKDGAGSMVHASNGKFYGMTVSGGNYDKGVLFEFDPSTETFIKKMDFDGSEKGSEPLGSLMEGSDGKLYGMTSMGGKYDAGILFSYDYASGSFAKLFDFNGEDLGSNPMGSLIEASNGMLYGMTRWGGANDHGIIFQFNLTDHQLNAVFEFKGAESGRNPHGSLTEASNGKLYGITPFGGTFNMGVLFEFDISSNTFINKYDFPEDFYIQSYGSLEKAPNGRLYGIIHNARDFPALLFDFNPEQGSVQVMGIVPYNLRDYYGSMESLTLASDGKMFFWGRDEFYIDKEVFLFEFDYKSNRITDYYENLNSPEGSHPTGELVQTRNGSFYALASRGGEFGNGLIFEFNLTSNTYKKIIDFDGLNKGATPTGSLVYADNERFYGMTRAGGAEGKGVLYEFDPVEGTFAKLIDFDGKGKGGNPNGKLVQALNGKLYGMTTTGGDYDYGVLFEFDPHAGTFKKLVDLTGTEKGYEPRNSLIQASNGMLYGVTKFGGASNRGMLFEFNIETDDFKNLLDFSNRPVAIMQATNNKLYISGYMSVIEYDPENNSSRNLKISSTAGFLGELFEVADDVLWGMDFGEIAYQSGIEDRGRIFEINMRTNDFLGKIEFIGPNGRHPENSGLIRFLKDEGPIAKCSNTVLYLDENGQAVLQPGDIDSGSSGNGIELTVSKSEFNCGDIGENNITLTVTDTAGNSAMCVAAVSVTDTISPLVNSKDLKIYLNASGTVEIVASDIDDASSDACGIESMVLDIASFTCENIGKNTVELTVTDNNGNVSSSRSTVEVVDSLAPEIACVSAVSRYINPNENAYRIKDAEWDAEATDNCQPATLMYTINGNGIESGKSLAGIELEAGTYEISWIAHDGSGNRSTCNSVIAIMKRPTALIIHGNDIDKEKGVIHLEAVLQDDLLSMGIEGKSLTFELDEYSKTALTDGTGKASVALPIKAGASGAMSVSVLFDEDATYWGSTSESEIITGTGINVAAKVNVFPNPFFERLYIEFISTESADARIDIIDPSGRTVKTIFNQQVESGMHYKAEFNPWAGADSYYLYRMKIGRSEYNGKVIYNK